MSREDQSWTMLSQSLWRECSEGVPTEETWKMLCVGTQRQLLIPRVLAILESRLTETYYRHDEPWNCIPPSYTLALAKLGLVPSTMALL